MKVLIGVDPHKASVAVAAIDEAKGEILERASFPQDRIGLRRLERWARRFPERRWAVENAGGLGRHLAVRLAAAGESVVDVPPKRLGARSGGRECSRTVSGPRMIEQPMPASQADAPLLSVEGLSLSPRFALHAASSFVCYLVGTFLAQ